MRNDVSFLSQFRPLQSALKLDCPSAPPTYAALMFICAAAGSANVAAARPRTATTALLFIEASFPVVENVRPLLVHATLTKGPWGNRPRPKRGLPGERHVAELQRKALPANQALERRADRLGERRIGWDICHSRKRLFLVVAERDQRLHDFGGAAALCRRGDFADATLELEQQALGGF